MGVVGWILLGELVLVSLVGAALAMLFGKIRDNRLMNALTQMAEGFGASELDRREEMQHLCDTLLRLPPIAARELIDALLAEEKRHLATVARMLLSRDMDAVSHFHEPLAYLTLFQLKETGNALHHNRIEGLSPCADAVTPKIDAPEPAGQTAIHEIQAIETEETAETAEPTAEMEEASTDDEIATEDAGQDDGVPALLSPDEVEALLLDVMAGVRPQGDTEEGTAAEAMADQSTPEEIQSAFFSGLGESDAPNPIDTGDAPSLEPAGADAADDGTTAAEPAEAVRDGLNENEGTTQDEWVDEEVATTPATGEADRAGKSGKRRKRGNKSRHSAPGGQQESQSDGGNDPG